MRAPDPHTSTGPTAASTLAQAVALHDACHGAVAMARLWQLHARRAAPGTQPVVVWKEAADARTWPVPQVGRGHRAAKVMACSWVDLGRTGPWRLELPEGVHGVVDDGWLRPVKRLGAVRGGAGGARYLLLGPTHDASAPAGTAVARCGTSGAWLTLAMAGDAGDAADGDASTALARLAALQFAPQSPGTHAAPLVFVERAGRPTEWRGFGDARFFAALARLAARERFAGLSATTRERLAHIGIRQGQRFAPDEALRALLDTAAALAINGQAADDGVPVPRSTPAVEALAPSPRWQRAFASAVGEGFGLGA